MVMVPFEDVVAYVKSEPEDDALVRDLIVAAEAYLKNGGVIKGAVDASLYILAVKGVVLHWYEIRNATGASDPNDFAIGTRHIINQLKQESLVMQVSNLDTC